MGTLEALLIERAGYVTRGLHARVAAVDAAIAALGHPAVPAEVEAPQALPPTVEHAVAPKAVRRK